MNARIDMPMDRIADFCKRWQITEFALFDSVVRSDANGESDTDVLARFHPDARHTLLDLVSLEDELKEILGREVQVAERATVEADRNYIRRKAILHSAEIVYAE